MVVQVFKPLCVIDSVGMAEDGACFAKLDLCGLDNVELVL